MCIPLGMTIYVLYDKNENLFEVEPDEYDSTELGEVPHDQNKGTNRPGYPGYYYGLAGVYRYEE